MESWMKISIMLCIFGVLKEFRPSEPYITKYLLSQRMNFTIDEVSNSIYPVAIYTTMASLILVFLLTDFLRYKPVIIFDGVCAVIIFIMLLTVRSLFLVQVVEVIYGLFAAGEVAYYTYIYAKVDKKHYQEVSGHTRAAYLVGRALSGIVAQLYITFNTSSLPYYNLNFFTLGGMILATIWACILPPVATSIYFGRIETEENNYPIELPESKDHQSKFMKSIRYLALDFYAAYSNIYIVKWMLWWSLATCGYYQILSYIQVLWEQILKDGNTKENDDWNGAVEATYTLLSALTAFTCGKVPLKWKYYGESVLAVCSLIIAFLLFSMSQTNSIVIAYITYIIYTIFYNGMITIANSEIATYLNPDSHGLIFGFTTFLALVFQSILTIAVSSIDDERFKFIIYSCYFGVLGITFVFIAVLKILRHLINKKSISENNDMNIS